MQCPACGSTMKDGELVCKTCGTMAVHGPKIRNATSFNTQSYDAIDEEAKKAAKEAGAKKAAEEAAAKAAEEAATRAAEEAAARRIAEGAAAMKAAEEAAARKAAEEAAKKAAAKKAAEEAAARAAEEAARKAAAKKAAVKKAAEEAARKAAAKKAEEDAAARKAAEEAARKAAAKKAEEDAAARKAAEEAARKAAEEAARKEAVKRAAEEAAAAKKAAEENAAVEAAIKSAIISAQETAAKKVSEEAAAKKAAGESAEKKIAGGSGSVSPPQRLSFKIIGGNLPSASVTLDEGQSIFTQSDVMLWMSRGIVMETKPKRGGSPFTAVYTSREYGQEIGIAARFPGEILVLNLSGSAIIMRKEAFLAAQPPVVLSAHISMNLGDDNEANISFQRLSGAGMAFIAIGGSMIERVLGQGETIKADTANIAAFEESVSFQTQIISDFQNTIYGEGLFLSTLTGPGKVWLQTMPVHK